jgi:flagellar secretion chaperone FliS
MSHPHPKQYLESRVQAASAPQLHLMLIEGAIRFCRQAEFEFKANNEQNANQALLRSLDIISELLAGVRHDESQLNQKLAGLYQYLFYTLTSAYVNADTEKLADVLRILEFERETWQLAVAKVRDEQRPATPIVAPHLAGGASLTGGVSLEA